VLKVVQEEVETNTQAITARRSMPKISLMDNDEGLLLQQFKQRMIVRTARQPKRGLQSVLRSVAAPVPHMSGECGPIMYIAGAQCGLLQTPQNLASWVVRICRGSDIRHQQPARRIFSFFLSL